MLNQRRTGGVTRASQSLLEGASLEVTAARISRVTDMESWRKRIPDVGGCDREAVTVLPLEDNLVTYV